MSKGGALIKTPAVSPYAASFSPLLVINMSAEVCCFVPLGHVYDAVYIAEAYIQFLMQILLFKQCRGGSCSVAG